jgi:BirA family transcriptional regulator, biotin operon repressor / biotin---[acetyl-CoA-carboxylase] ligase
MSESRAVWPAEVIDTALRLEALASEWKLSWFEQLPSTNDLALRWAEDGSVDLPHVLWADRQTAGRGRGPNRWWSTAGALTCTLITDAATTSLSAAEWPKLSVVTGLAIAEALGRWCSPGRLGLKWPNDVWIDGKKVGGILLEVPRGQPQRVVVGFGMNVRNSFAAAPAELRGLATSLCDTLPQPPTVAELLVAVCQHWEQRVASLAAGELDLPALWSRLCVLTGYPVHVTNAGPTLAGVCQGIGPDGSLLVETDSGTQRLFAGTVRRATP